MQLPQIRLQTKSAQIVMQQHLGKHYIRQQHADMSIEQPKAQLVMQTRPAKLTIDQTRAWADMNLMPIKKRIALAAQRGTQAVYEGMARKAKQGKQLMKIEHGGDPIREQAIANAARPTKTLGIDFIPSFGAVKIDVIPADLQIAAEANQPIIHATPHRPEYTFERGYVDISIAQYEQLEIDFVNIFSKSI